MVGNSRNDREVFKASMASGRQRDDVFAVVAHELRRPLAPITAALHVLRTKGHSCSELDIIDRQVKSLARLIEDIFDASIVSAGGIDLRKERVQIADVLTAAVELMKPLLDQRRHQISLEVPPAAIFVLADFQRMVQVVSNLLSNAANYSDPGTRITIRVQETPGHVSIHVIDQGVGMPQSAIESIFERFIRHTPQLRPVPVGLGLGLSIVRSFVELHGGRVSAHSDGPGKGSRFTVELPTVICD